MLGAAGSAGPQKQVLGIFTPNIASPRLARPPVRGRKVICSFVLATLTATLITTLIAALMSS